MWRAHLDAHEDLHRARVHGRTPEARVVHDEACRDSSMLLVCIEQHVACVHRRERKTIISNAINIMIKLWFKSLGPDNFILSEPGKVVRIRCK